MNYKIQLLAQKYISTIEQERKWDDEIRLIESAITYSYIEIQNYFLQVRDKGAQARKTFYWILPTLQNEQAEEILFAKAGKVAKDFQKTYSNLDNVRIEAFHDKSDHHVGIWVSIDGTTYEDARKNNLIAFG